VEMAEALAPETESADLLDVEEVATPDIKTIEDVCKALDVAANRTVKTLIVKGSESDLIALVLRGDHQLNAIKAEKIEGVASPLTMASEAEIKTALGAGTGSIGPQGLSIPIIADRSAAALRNFIAGANKDDFHTRNVNWERDASANAIEDIRDVVEGDPSPDGKGEIRFKRGIEVGHIFQLGDKYSKAMNATVLDESGKAVVMQMGCYGMGVTRLVGAIIEQNHDERGIIWPESIAPFRVIVIPINAHKSEQVRNTAESLYKELTGNGVEVLLDDREDVRPGAKFADAELMGIPHRLVIGDRGLDNGVVEYVNRRDGENSDLTLDDVRTLFI